MMNGMKREVLILKDKRNASQKNLAIKSGSTTPDYNNSLQVFYCHDFHSHGKTQYAYTAHSRVFTLHAVLN